MSEAATKEALRLELRKKVKSTRSEAYASWTQPELLRQWFCPGQMTAAEVEVDLSVGGKLRFLIEGTSPVSGQPAKLKFTGTFLEIVPERKLRFGWEVAGDPGDPTEVMVEFLDAEEGVEVVLTQERVPSEAILNRNKMGWGGMFEKMAALLAARA